MPSADPDPARSNAAASESDAWLDVDVVHDDGDWPDEAHVASLIASATAALAAHPGIRGRPMAQACLALSSDAAVQRLNASYRGKDQPTNVLSFPAGDHGPPGEPALLGDIVLALETLEREAGERGIPFAHHLQHLTIHGLLHLLGYDHETAAEASEMEQLETAILANLDIPDPYADSEPLNEAG